MSHAFAVPDRSPSNLLKRLWRMDDVQRKSLLDMVPVASLAIALVTPIGGGLIWMTGGFTPQQQVVAADLRRNVDELKSGVTEIKTIIQSMPRPSDFVDVQRHLSAIDARFDDVNKRITADEIDQATTRAQLQHQFDQQRK